MVLGFNHNVRYKGDIFHVQTEDSGVANPNITTLLYRGGTIIASRKTSYEDIIRFEGLARLVEEMMKEQHKEMLRRLKNGEFDDRAFPEGGPEAAVPSPSRAEPAQSPVPVPRDPSRNLDDILLDYLASEGREYYNLTKEQT
jgi:hypothetical protein